MVERAQQPVNFMHRIDVALEKPQNSLFTPPHPPPPKKEKTLSLCFTCEIEFLTFNFMDEIKNCNTNQFPAVQLQGNGLCPRRLKPAFRGKDKTWTESGTNMLIYMHILSVGNLRKYRGHFISRILFTYE